MPNTPQAKLLIKVLKITLVIIALIAAIAIYGFIHYKNQGINLLQSENWLYFPGATVTNNGVHFQSLNRIIVHQDGSVGQSNPPVNVSGQHLLVKGDFKITAVVSQIDTRKLSFEMQLSVVGKEYEKNRQKEEKEAAFPPLRSV